MNKSFAVFSTLLCQMQLGNRCRTLTPCILFIGFAGNKIYGDCSALLEKAIKATAGRLLLNVNLAVAFFAFWALMELLYGYYNFLLQKRFCIAFIICNINFKYVYSR